MNFNDIIGHSEIKSQITYCVDNNKLSHAHLFMGADGIGKSVLAKAFAAKILGKEADRDYVDIMHYKVKSDKKSIGVDEVRAIIEELNKKPYEGDKKVAIVHNCDKMTEEAQNAFLKTVEEPAKGVYIILLCENSESILDTIKSRCQIYKFQKLNFEEMSKYLSLHHPELGAPEKKSLMIFGDGIPGRAEGLLTDVRLKDMRDKCMEVMVGLRVKNTMELLKCGAFFEKYRADWQEVLTWLLSYIRDTIVYKETGNEGLVINVDKMSEIKEIASRFSFNKLSDMIDNINSAKDNLISNVNASLVFDSLILKLQDK